MNPWVAVAAAVETLEARELLSSIVVNSTSGGQNYASTVTASQLNPTQTAVTLRDAIDAANNTQGADTITFDSSVFAPNASTTIVLSGGTPLVLSDTSGATTITGPGAAEVTVSGNNQSTVLVVNSGVTATLSGLTITGGKGSISLGGGMTGAGGIYNNGKLTVQNMVFAANAGGTFGGGLYNNNSVTISDSVFSGNSAQFGGGLFNGGSAVVTGTTFSGNSATTNGGAFYNLATITLDDSTLSSNTAGTSGGGFYSNNTATVVNSTIAGNSAGTSGGGFINLKTATVLESTIAGNFASQGGGVYNSFATVTLSGTIVAQNAVSPTNSASSDWGGSSASANSTYNLIGDGANTGLVGGVNGNLVGSAASPLDPHLAALADNGGPTQTMALLAGSAAINAGSNTLATSLTSDQRGSGFARVAGGTVDIGAFEIQSHPPAAPTVNALSTTSTTPTLSGTWDAANAVVLQVTISNSAGSSVASYALGTDPQLSVSGAAWTLNLAGTPPLSIGSYQVRVHTVNDIGEASDSAVGSLTVNSTPPVVGSIGSQTARIGQSISITAAITGGDTTGLVATIDWGDGTTTAGTITTVSGALTVSGSHAYSAEGQFKIDLTATNASSLSGSASATATILSLVPSTPTVSSLTTTQTTPTLSGTWDATYAVVLQVTISNSAGSYAATYTLGTDSQLSVSGATWALNLAGSTPLAVGTYTVLVHTANDIGERSDRTLGSLTIESTPPVLGSLAPQSGNVGTPIVVTAAITGGDTTDLVATINWGDGTTSAGTTATVNGVLTASGSHSYSSAGQFNVQLTVTNASGLSASAATTATIASVSTGADLQVTAGENVQIVATNAAASYDFAVKFVSGGMKLIGVNGTTFNGAQSLFIANVKSVSIELGNGDNHVRISGSARNVLLSAGDGRNQIVLSGLRVAAETQIDLGSGANVVKIDDSRFKNFKFQSTGKGTIVRIESGRPDGAGTEFDGSAVFLVGGGARLSFSPSSSSEATRFDGHLVINASAPGALWHFQNVSFAHRPTLHGVRIV